MTVPWRVLLHHYVFLSSMKSLDVQVGGNHYKGLSYQPVKLTADLNLNFIQGNIVKYVSRYRFKNGKQDLEKVLHYAQLGQELQPLNFVPLDSVMQTIRDYAILNGLPDIVGLVIEGAVFQNWSQITIIVEKLIRQEYE